MPQQQSPFLEGKYGWNFGESGWNTGMDENLLKFSYMFDRNVDGIVSSLPAAVNGQAYFLTTDNRLYFAVGNTWYSSPVPKWFEFKIRSTGDVYQFNGTSVVQIESPADLDARLDAIELTVSTLGSAAFEDVSAFATTEELDIVASQANSYVDQNAIRHIKDIATLRATDATFPNESVFLLGYYSDTPGKGHGVFVADTASTLPDDGGLVIVSSGGTRWKRQWSDAVTPEDFGARGDGVADDSAAWQAVLDATGNLIPVVADLDYLMTSSVSGSGVGYRIRGSGKFIAGTDSMTRLFDFSDCPQGVWLEGHSWDAADIGKGFVRFTGCPNSRVRPALVTSFKDDATTAGLYSAFLFMYSPYSTVEGGLYINIGQNFGGSEEQPAQYRCVTLNSGCDGFIWRPDTCTGVFQGIVAAEWPRWASGNNYQVNDYVHKVVAGVNNLYRCIADHSSNGANEPPNAGFWVLEKADVRPTDAYAIEGGFFRNVRDNAIYALEHTGACSVLGSQFLSSNDEPIVALSRSLIVDGCLFRDTANKAIAIDTSKIDIEAVQITNNRFENFSANYNGNFIVYRNSPGSPYQVKVLQITGNTFYSAFSIGSASFVRLLKAGSLLVCDNVFDVAAGAGEIVIRVEDTVLNGLVSSNVINTASSTAIMFRDDSTGSKILYSSPRGNGRALVNSANTVPQLVLFDITAGNTYARESNRRIGWGATAPSAGAWSQGDVILATAPTAGGFIGWVCTTAGTPGTWKTFGTISA